MPSTLSYTVLSPALAAAAAPGGSDGNLAEITDVADQGILRLIPEYLETPRWQAWIRSSLDRHQDIETALYDMWANALSIDDGGTDQLDLIGRIVRESRNGRSNDDYRRALRVRVLVNRSQGRASDLIGIANIFAEVADEVGAYVRLKDGPSGRTAEVRTVRTPTWTRGELNTRLQQAKPAGVRLSTIITPGGPTGSFLLYNTATTSYPVGSALGLRNTTTGSPAGGVLGDVTG